MPAVNVPNNIVPGQGIDLVTDVSERLDEVKQNRLDFVARYYRPPESRWPALSVGEAQLLSGLGVKIVAVWEWHSRYATHFNYSTGYDDAVMAYGQAKAVGQPAGSAIYFAVDFDARSLAPIDEYFRGVAAGLAAASGGNADYTIGVYGSGAVCGAIKQAHLAQYTWLSNSSSWAESIGYDDWNIRQGGRSLPLSFNHDFDETKDEYGGFLLAGYGEPASAGIGPRDHNPPQKPQEQQAQASALIPLR
ncbi:MAG TPA: glycoside hydrolase domain-containing protein [Stellaceae bacterium]